MEKSNTVIVNNIQNESDFEKDFSPLTSAFNANIIPGRSFQRVALLTLILLGNVAWVPPSYGMNEQEVRQAGSSLGVRLANFVNNVRETPCGTVLERGWARLRAHFERENSEYQILCTNKAIDLDTSNTELHICNIEKSAKTGALGTCETNLQALYDEKQRLSNKLHAHINSCEIENNTKTTALTTCEKILKDQDNSLNAQQIELDEHKNLYCQVQSDLTWWQDRAKLAGYSAVVGAVSSLLPEMIKDGVSLTRYAEYANKVGVAVTLLEGGLIAYNAASYSPSLSGMFLPALTGTAVRCGLNYCGFAPDKSVTAGNAVAILTSFAQGWILGQEASLYDVLDHGIAVAGNWGGSVLALHLYDFGKSPFRKPQENNNPPNNSPHNDFPGDNPSTPTVQENTTNTPRDDSENYSSSSSSDDSDDDISAALVQENTTNLAPSTSNPKGELHMVLKINRGPNS